MKDFILLTYGFSTYVFGVFIGNLFPISSKKNINKLNAISKYIDSRCNANNSIPKNVITKADEIIEKL